MDLLYLIRKHKKFLPESLFKSLSPIQKGDCTAVEDLLVLYLLILEYCPQHIIEFSPMLGYSTRWLATAMKNLQQSDAMITVEQNPVYFRTAQNRLKKDGLDKYCHIIHGNALSVIPKEINNMNYNVELAFIDSAHSYGFAKQYIENIFPLLSPHCYIMAHDIITTDEGFTCPLGNEQTKDTPRFQEYKALQEYLESHNLSWILTSQLFGIDIFCLEPDKRTNIIYEQISAELGFDWTQYLNWVSPLGLLFKLDGEL